MHKLWFFLRGGFHFCFFIIKYWTVFESQHSGVTIQLYPQCLVFVDVGGGGWWSCRVHLMCDRTHREVTKPLKTPIKHTHQNTPHSLR